MSLEAGTNMNDNERRLWVLNDEELYKWWTSTRLSLARFIKLNRKQLTAIIKRLLG